MPTLSATNDGAAGALFQSAVQAAAVDLSHLSPLAQVQLAVAQLYTSDPTTINVPAGDVLSGTFGANKAGGADSGDYTFPSGVIFGTLASSTTALATPSALAATAFNTFASTVSGAVMMGFGTTHDVALKNRAGTTALGILANTTTVALAGIMTVAGAATFSSTVRVNGAASLGTAAGTDQTVIDGTGFGAGVASLRLNGLTTAATNNLVGTLTNSPVTGNPTFWMPVSIAGVVKYIPCW